MQCLRLCSTDWLNSFSGICQAKPFCNGADGLQAREILKVFLHHRRNAHQYWIRVKQQHIASYEPGHLALPTFHPSFQTVKCPEARQWQPCTWQHLHLHFTLFLSDIQVSSSTRMAAVDLAIVGPGVLGSLVASQWRTAHPTATIALVFRSGAD